MVTASPDVAVQWDAPDAARVPSTDARRALDEWAEARGFRLVAPRPSPLPIVAVDATVAASVEDELDHARDALTALDAPATDHALANAEALLRDHPELPQAAWLRAEVLRARATRFRRLPPHDAARSTADWLDAASLDGGRVAGVGEVAPAAGLPAGPMGTVVVERAGDDDADHAVVRLDGVLVPGATLATVAGEHQLTVTYEGALVRAAWVTVEAGKTLRITPPEPAACSPHDLGRARLVDGRVVATGIRCRAWVFARESATSRGELSLATCEGAACGTPFIWSVGPMGPVLPEARRATMRWPAWATWTLVGAGAAAVAGATLAATGVLRPTHAEPVFTTGGLHTSSLPILVRFGE